VSDTTCFAHNFSSSVGIISPDVNVKLTPIKRLELLLGRLNKT
jgi:hypothetical protein